MKNTDIKSIGILGGTFNPIHNGHLKLVQAAKKEFNIERILVMPSGISYLKSGTGVLPSDIRLKMTELACIDLKDIYVDDREVRREGNSYTCDTVLELNEEYATDCVFYYIIGADTLLSIHKWKNIDIIFKRCVILVAVRTGSPALELEVERQKLQEAYAADIRFLNFEGFDCSSTDIRDRVKKGLAISGLLPLAVEKYIMDNKLYID